MRRYNPKEIDPKWQKIWDETEVYKADLGSSRPKYIAMSMFNYPSGHGIHIGHAMNYTISDVMARFKRQQGYESYHPVGWDAFGLPAENYAIKTGVSPQASMASIIPGYHKQYRAMGWSNDWSKEISTHLPEYYKWTQWIFAEMFRAGMAYQDARLQWWCTKCQTVLANEQVIDGKCWRHDAPDDPEVKKREVKQWFFKVTDYADEMLDATYDLDWSEVVKTAQVNWIGKSQGAEVEFAVGDKQYEAKDTLKFTPELTEAIQKGDKSVTYRLEPKNLQAGDIAKLVTRFNPKETRAFAYAKITKVEKVSLKDLPNDRPGHEPYSSVDEKLQDYKGYYGDHVTLESEFTIYTFEKVADIVTVFTTRPDTLYGATFMVLAPEHELVSRITTDTQKAEVEAYVTAAEKKTDVERQESKEKTGVFTGAYAVNPVNGTQIPIWIADYVLTGYGTGAIMAVPAHDERDHEFAEKFGLPIVEVVSPGLVGTGKNAPKEKVETVVRPVVDAIIRNQKGEYLLQIEEDNVHFVGGGTDGEDDETAVHREVLEEVGFDDIQSIRPVSSTITMNGFRIPKNINQQTTGRFFEVVLASDHQVRSEIEDGKHTIEWVAKEDIAARLTWEHHQLGWQQYLEGDSCWHDEGVMMNSGEYNGMPSAEAREQIIADLAAKGVAEPKTNFRIRDWSVSRQRYWGAPIPIINCPTHGAVLDPNLPVVLPELEDFQPSGDGRSALARAAEWLHVPCPICGEPGERETDTLDTYICSSWYFLRYLDPANAERAFDSGIANKWMPIDFYNGGDHATAHMIYARFVTRFFWHQGLLDEPEPFKHFLFNGKVTASDGTMFSKSKGNGVDPLEIIDSGYGADALRTYLMFAAPLELWMRWDPQGVPGTFRFLQRVWNLVQEFLESTDSPVSQDETVLRIIHPVIKKVTADLEEQKYNTAIAAMMKCVNDLYALKASDGFANQEAWQFTLDSLVALVAPFAPHTADELWQQLGHETTVQRDSWPLFEEAYCVADTVTLAIQVNGKLRGTVEVPADADEAASVEAAKNDEKVASYLAEGSLVKTIYVPAKLINFVVR